MKKQFLAAAVVGLFAGLVVGAGQASAHAISIGFENAGPGSVNIWLGTYGHGGHHLEGSLQLEGVLGTVFGPTVNPFTMLTGTGVGFKPAGLIDGTTNFYADWNGSVPNSLPLVATEAPFNAGCPACGPVDHWQGVTFAGLGEGDYQFTYIPIASPSAEWSLLSTNMDGVFHLGREIVDPGEVPEPFTLTLFGAGLAGLAAMRRRKVKSA
ncbi:MAG TPA: PEP-CTERM sorting domain-containing protein [Rhizomicrobium sp.]|nr:PEP-CTERM sorting domain-containing protein [Rhizomicrobium sp.]